jgi:hypothetical protein
VDIGIPLSVFLEGASFKGLGVLPGDGIRIHIPRESIRVF